MNTPARPPAPPPRSVARLLAAITAITIIAGLAGYLSWQSSIAAQREALSQRLVLYSTTLNAELERFEALPFVVALEPKLARMLANTSNPELRDELNRYLAAVNAEAGSAQIFLLDARGTTLASSNWLSSDSLIGNNYAFRPYFRAALAGDTGRFYGVGATTRLPGMFIARPVRLGGRVAGVVVTKIDLSPLEAAWADSGEKMLVADQHGVVTLAARRVWKFATLGPLSQATRMRLEATRQYYTSPLLPLPFAWRGRERIAIGDHDYLVVSRAVGRLNWQMRLMGDLAEARSRAWLSAAVTGLALLVLALAALYARLRLKRLRERLAAQLTLERTVAERTAELASANLRLQAEINDKRQAETALRAAQTELIQSSKLAALGRMATGIAHELNQPLAALRSFADNTRQYLALGRQQQADANLERIIAQTDKLGSMTAELKLFATRRPVRGHCDLAALRPTLDAALAPRLAAARARLCWDMPQPCPLPLEALAAEQIIGNLVSNAADALGDTAQRDILLQVQRHADAVQLQVSDHGPGLPPDNPARVFEPFYSTKSYGSGLGLGLAIVAGIVRDAGGDISASNLATGGACFSIRLPLTHADSP